MHLDGAPVAVIAAWIGHSDPTPTIERVRTVFAQFIVEPMTGIEPAYSAWELFSTSERVSDSRW
jgi:hypothetical protein